MKSFFWALTILGSLLGAAVFAFGLFASKGAPQDAAAAAIGLALAVIPYYLVRAVTEMGKS